MAGQKLDIRGPFYGLVTNRDASLLDPREASDCENVILDRNGISRRKPWTQDYTGTLQSSSFSDTFDRADGATLGGSWTETESGQAIAIVSNVAAITTSTATATGNCVATNSTAVGVNYLMTAIFTITSTGGSGKVGLLTRCDAANPSAYLWFYIDGIGNFGVQRDSGLTDVVALTPHATGTGSSPYTLKVLVMGTRYMFFINGIKQCEFTDASTKSRVRFGFKATGLLSGDGETATVNTFTVTQVQPPRSLTGAGSALDNSYKLFFGQYDDWKSLDEVKTLATITSSLTNGDEDFVPYTDKLNNVMAVMSRASQGKMHKAYSDFAQVGNGWHITGPASAPTTAASGTSTMVGTYDYKYTYYSSTYGMESAPSSASTELALASQGTLLTLTTTSDARVDKMRIYRRKASSGESAWTFVAEIAEAASYSDTIGDRDRDETRFPPVYTGLSDVTEDEWGHVCQHKARLFCVNADTAGNEGKLYYSKERDLEILNYLTFTDSGASFAPTCTASFQGLLVIFSRDAVWTLSGSGPADWRPLPLYKGDGCVAPMSIVQSEGYLYWCGNTAIYRWDGMSMPEAISDPIGKTYNESSKVFAEYHCGANAQDDGLIIWSLYGKDESGMYTQLVYHYRHSRMVQRHCWTKFDSGSIEINSMFWGWNPYRKMYCLNFGGQTTSNFYIGVYGPGTNANDSTTLASWTTGRIGKEEPLLLKTWGQVWAEWIPPTATTATTKLSAYLDYPTVSAATVWSGGSMTKSTKFGQVNGLSRYLRLKLELDAILTVDDNGSVPENDPITFLGFGIEYEYAGRADA